MSASRPSSPPQPTRQRAIWLIAAAFLVVGIAFILLLQRDDPDPVQKPADPVSPQVAEFEPPSRKGYVGSQSCAECHPGIFESYQKHPMYNSLASITPDTPTHLPGDQPVEIQGPHRTHLVQMKDGALWHHEQMRDSQGDLLYDQGVQVKYVVGSGQRAKAYLHQRGGLLFMSPLNWYSESDTWDFAPNYTSDDPRRFDRRVTDDCLNCHAGRVAPKGRSLNQYEHPAFLEESIGCENCHGPGADHIDFHNSKKGRLAEDPIVNPKDLPPNERESVCYQCHLTGAVRVLRYGRSDFDFRPGMRLDDVWHVLVTDAGETEDGRSKAVNQVQQVRSSRCFLESQGKFGCISCHDSHRDPPASERVEFYRNRCNACHAAAGCGLPLAAREEESNSCIACHMPSRGTTNIAHVTQTDHRILRRYADLPESSESKAGEELSFFDKIGLDMPEWEKERALGLGSRLYLSKTGRPLPLPLIRKLDGVLETVPRDGAVLATLGAIGLDHGELDLARKYLERAREIPYAEETAMEGLLKVHYLSSNWEEAIKCADWLVNLDPGNYRAQAMRADSLNRLGRLQEAISAAESAIQYNPTLVELRGLLADWYRMAGQTDREREQSRILKAMKQVLSE